MFIRLLALLVDILIMLIVFGGPIYGVYYLIKRLIRYNAECQDRYARQRKKEQDLDDLEDELEYMKDYDWSKDDK